MCISLLWMILSCIRFSSKLANKETHSTVQKKYNNWKETVSKYQYTWQLFCYSLCSMMKGQSSKSLSSCCFSVAHLSQFGAVTDGSDPRLLWTPANVTTVSIIKGSFSVAVNRKSNTTHAYDAHTWSSVWTLALGGLFCWQERPDVSNQHLALQLAYVSALA